MSALIQPALANPFPKDDLHDTLGQGFLQDRLCASYCGLQNELCCSEGESCTTSDSVAGCAAAAPTLAPRQANGVWSIYTTTWTETDTFTSTISNYWAASTGAAGGTCTPAAGSGNIACGSICCASWQYCAYEGQCLSNPGATATDTATTAWSTYATTMTTAGSTITTQYSAPYRVTGTGSTTTNTATVESATTTSAGNGTVVSTTGGSSLSGGAIAGIVVGTLAGVALLLALCFCCIMRGLWHGLLALLGLGPKKRDRSRERETIIVEEERYRRGGSHAGRDTHTSWFSGRPARSTAAESRRTSEKIPPSSRRGSTQKQTSWWGAGALGTMLLLLGLRRDKKRRSQSTATAQRTERRTTTARSDVSSSYFPGSYTDSPSEFSSDYTYSSVYTPAPAPAPAPGRSSSRRPLSRGGPGGPRSASVARSQSVRSASRYRDDDRGDYEYVVVHDPHEVSRGDYDPPHPPKSNLPPDYAGSLSSGGRTRDTRDTRRSRRTETTRVSRAPSRR